MNDKLMSEYREAFHAAKGYEPDIAVLPNGRFSIATDAGAHDGYTARDVANLTRGLRSIAKAQEGKA